MEAQNRGHHHLQQPQQNQRHHTFSHHALLDSLWAKRKANGARVCRGAGAPAVSRPNRDVFSCFNMLSPPSSRVESSKKCARNRKQSTTSSSGGRGKRHGRHTGKERRRATLRIHRQAGEPATRNRMKGAEGWEGGGGWSGEPLKRRWERLVLPTSSYKKKSGAILHARRQPTTTATTELSFPEVKPPVIPVIPVISPGTVAGLRAKGHCTCCSFFPHRLGGLPRRLSETN